MMKRSDRQFIGFLLMVGGLVWSLVAIFELAKGKPTFPPDFPKEILSVKSFREDIPAEGNQFRIASDYSKPISIKFSKETSIEGLWRRTAARIQTTGGIAWESPTFPEVERNWGDRMTIRQHSAARPVAECEPQLSVKLPISDEWTHKTVDVSVWMDIEYPALSAQTAGLSYSFSNEHKSLTRRFTLYVLSPSEMALAEKYDTWQRRLDFILFGFAGLVLAGVGAYLVKKA